MDVPAEEKGGVGAERDGADEVVPVGTQPEFDEGELWCLFALVGDGKNVRVD